LRHCHFRQWRNGVAKLAVAQVARKVFPLFSRFKHSLTVKNKWIDFAVPHRNNYHHPNLRHNQPSSFHPKALVFKNKCRNFAAITKDM